MKRISLTLIFTLLFSVAIAAQSTAGVKKNPYVPGEHLTYEGKYKFIGISVTVVDLNFEVSNGENPKTYEISSLAESRGVLVKLLNFSFKQDYKSIVDAEKLHILKTEKYDQQGSRIRESVADFDYLKHEVIWTESDPKDPSKSPRRVATTIPFDTYDLVTAAYTIRGMPLAVGNSFTLNVSDSGLLYEVPIHVTGREQIDSKLGKRWCFIIEPEIFGEDRFIEQEGSIKIWITDDNQRVPVRAKLDTKIGGVEIKLKNASGLVPNSMMITK